jgi:hypothetical protein
MAVLALGADLAHTPRAARWGGQNVPGLRPGRGVFRFGFLSHSTFDPRRYLEWDGPTGLLLDDGGPLTNSAARCYVAHAKFDQVATPQLRVDGAIE